MALRGFVLVLAIAAIAVYWLTARGWQLRGRVTEFREHDQVDIRILSLPGSLRSRFVRIAAAALLLAWALRFFLGRYEMVWNDHGFMVGVDYVDRLITLPLQWVVISACLVAAGLVTAGRWKLASWMALALVIRIGGPVAVRAIYVGPNEISIERPYIQQHIQATRSAFGLDRRLTETEVAAKLDGPFDPRKTRRCSTMSGFGTGAPSTTRSRRFRRCGRTTFSDTDVDRYTHRRPIAPGIADTARTGYQQLPAASASWINPHFIYTHGYGLVMAEANRITPTVCRCSSFRMLLPVVKTPEPETDPARALLRGSHSRAGVCQTEQPEFNYPSGADNVSLTTRARAGSRFRPSHAPCGRARGR